MTTKISSIGVEQSAITQHKHKCNHEPEKTLFEGMKEYQAKDAGDDLYAKFLLADKDHNHVLSQKEFTEYNGQGVNEELVKEFANLSDEEKLLKIVDTMLGERGKEKIEKLRQKLKETGKTDATTLIQEELGINLNDFKTDKEKKDAIFNAMQQKFSTEATEDEYNSELSETDSIYLQTYKKLKQGDFSILGPLAHKVRGFEDQLDDDQLKALAKEHTENMQAFEMVTIMAQLDDNDRSLISDRLIDYNEHTQTMAWGASIALAETLEEKLALAEKFNKEIKAKIDASGETGQLSAFMIQRYSSLEATRNKLLDGGYGHGHSQHCAFVTADKAELHKLETGQISQADYDKNYAEIYAGMAHELDNAADAYKYVMDNAYQVKDEKYRNSAINTLAANAYQIKDENQRNSAIGMLKNSEYYNSDVESSLDSSYQRHLTEQALGSTGSAPYTTVPITNTDIESSYIKSILKSNNDEAKLELTNKTLSDLDKPGEQITPKERHLKQQNAVTLLNYVISNNLLQNSKYERIVLSKLSAKPLPTLLNMFLNCNAKVQNYFYINHLVTPLSIAMNASDQQIKQLPDSIKEKIEEYKPNLAKQENKA